MQVVVFLVLEAAYLFTAAESSDLEVSCLSAFCCWYLSAHSHTDLLPFGGLITSIPIKTILYPNVIPWKTSQYYRAWAATFVFISVFSSSLYKIRPLKELPVYSIFLLHSNPPLHRLLSVSYKASHEIINHSYNFLNDFVLLHVKPADSLLHDWFTWKLNRKNITC